MGSGWRFSAARARAEKNEGIDTRTRPRQCLRKSITDETNRGVSGLPYPPKWKTAIFVSVIS